MKDDDYWPKYDWLAVAACIGALCLLALFWGAVVYLVYLWAYL